MIRIRLDQAIAQRGLLPTRSQAESFIKLGAVRVDGRVITKPGLMVTDQMAIAVDAPERYVSRAGLKLASVAHALRLKFDDTVVLDVGSSTGGFTDFALQHGARKVVAVDVGTDQLHQSLRNNPKIELHEKTDIRDFVSSEHFDIIVADVSFISLREILPHLALLAAPDTALVVMVKPQFEAGTSRVTHNGVIKNDRLRRDILKDFELWVRRSFIVVDKADSDIAGAKGNRERFYLLRVAKKTNSSFFV